MELIGISGWSFGAESIAPLRDALGYSGYSISSESLFADQSPEEHLLQLLPSQPVHVLAWSLGSMIALAAARSAPQRFASLLLLGSAAQFVRSPGNRRGIPRRIVESMVVRMATEPLSVVQEFSATVAGERIIDAEWLASVEVARLCAGLKFLCTFDIRSALHEIPVPTLLIHGGADSVVPLAANDSLAAGLPRVQRLIIPEAGHMPWGNASARESLIGVASDFLHAVSGG